MQSEAKAKAWVESKTEVKNLRKGIKNTGKTTTPESHFTYSAQLKPILQQAKKLTSKERQQKKKVREVFLTGTNVERKALQLRAVKESKRRKAKEKRKRKKRKRRYEKKKNEKVVFIYY